MTSKTFKVQNFTYPKPSYVKNNQITLPVHKVVKHYLDELTEQYDQWDKNMEILILHKRLVYSSEFKFKPQYKPPFTESKRGVSNLFGRAISKALLDHHEQVGIYDDFDVYYTSSRRHRRIPLARDIFARKKNTKERGPDLLAKDKTGDFVIVESKGRLQKYSKKALNDFVTQSQNGEVYSASTGSVYKAKHWAVPVYISYDHKSSIVSMVDPPSEGISNRDEPNDRVERAHYTRVFSNLGLYDFTLLLPDHRYYGDRSKYFELSVGRHKINNKLYVFHPERSKEDIHFMNDYSNVLPLKRKPYLYCMNLEVFRYFKEFVFTNGNDGSLYEIHSVLAKIRDNKSSSSEDLECYDGSLIASPNDFTDIHRELI